jgi:hypothetical protein
MALPQDIRYLRRRVTPLVLRFMGNRKFLGEIAV